MAKQPEDMTPVDSQIIMAIRDATDETKTCIGDEVGKLRDRVDGQFDALRRDHCDPNAAAISKLEGYRDAWANGRASRDERMAMANSVRASDNMRAMLSTPGIKLLAGVIMAVLVGAGAFLIKVLPVVVKLIEDGK